MAVPICRGSENAGEDEIMTREIRKRSRFALIGMARLTQQGALTESGRLPSVYNDRLM